MSDEYKPEPGHIIDGWHYPTPFIVLKIEDGKIFGVRENWNPGILQEWTVDRYRKLGMINPARLEELKEKYLK